jgi:hypothetical protein
MKENETLLDMAWGNYNAAKVLLLQSENDELFLNYAGYHLQQVNQSNIDIGVTEYIDEHSEMLSSWESQTRYIKNYRLERRKLDRALSEVSVFLQAVDDLATLRL